jgi:hypothetical protein
MRRLRKPSCAQGALLEQRNVHLARDVILDEIRRQCLTPFRLEQVLGRMGHTATGGDLAGCLASAEGETVDYGVMEHAERVVVVPAGGLGWSDVVPGILSLSAPALTCGNVSSNAQHLASRPTIPWYTAELERLIVTIGWTIR